MIIEKKHYPFHRVCGEYVSNETIRFLRAQGLFPEAYAPPVINEFLLSSVQGKSVRIQLDLGGFGISRYTFDNFLYEIAAKEGVEFKLNTDVEAIHFQNDTFYLTTNQADFATDILVGSFGKRSVLDSKLKRTFFKKRSPYVGVKYHIRTSHPSNVIALHNFRDGYCGISNIEETKTNLCYLTHGDNLRKYKNIRKMEEEVLFENPHLRKIFTSSIFLFDKPEVINEVSFETKEPVWNHILMAGDAAGMIAPLCGNGMAMAIHSAKILSEVISKQIQSHEFNREKMEHDYRCQWNAIFANRLWRGRIIQNHLFGTVWSSQLAVNIALRSKWLTNAIIRSTHGEIF